MSSDATDCEATGSELSKRSDSCRTERPQLRSRKRAFVSEPPQRVKQTVPRPSARGLRKRPPATAVTVCTVPVTSSAGSLPLVTVVTARVTGPVTANTTTESGQWARVPRQDLAAGAAATRAGGRAGGTTTAWLNQLLTDRKIYARADLK